MGMVRLGTGGDLAHGEGLHRCLGREKAAGKQEAGGAMRAWLELGSGILPQCSKTSKG